MSSGEPKDEPGASPSRSGSARPAASTAGAGKEVRPRAAPSAPPAPPENQLVTSEDLFGDLVDEPAPPRRPPPPKPAAVAAGPRKGPIRVQVSEPGAKKGISPLATPGSEGPLPEDVAALLDAFGGAEEEPPAPVPAAPAPRPARPPAATRPLAAARPPVAIETVGVEQVFDALVAGPAEPAPAEAPPPAVEEEPLASLAAEAPWPEPVAAPAPPALAGAESDVLAPDLPAPDEIAAGDLVPDDLSPDLLEALEPEAAAPESPPPAPPEPRAAAPAATSSATQRFQLPPLEATLPPLAPPPAPGDDEPVLSLDDIPDVIELPRPASRTGTRFRAAAPAAAPPPGPGLDLAALAAEVEAAAGPLRPKVAPAPPRPSTARTIAFDLKALAEQLPKPASRTGTKFAAVKPKAEAPAGGLDLSVLADEAFGASTPPHPEPVPAELPVPRAPARPPAPPATTPTGVATPTPSAPTPTSAGRTGPAPTAAEAAAGPGEASYGPYRLLEKVAVGGMAEVFKAKRTGVEGFEKVLAVKRILPHLSDNKEFVDMFVDEAKMVAGLAHPNIVQIFDLGRIEKTYYIAMEYVHGRDLRSIMRRARERGLRIPLDLTAFVVSRVCAALEYAHRKKDDRGKPMRIVHRDVSPQNILISFEGDVKLADFGIAKAATKATATDRGALRGKLLYMSPEQASGKPMDRRSDLYSLGIVFYEMVTEQRPFQAQGEVSVLELVREGRIAPPSSINPKIPEKLERVMLKALEKDPDARYQDAADFFRDLERILHERQPPTPLALARFLEILFDPEERGDAVAAEGTERTGPTASGFEIDFEHTLPQGASPAENRAPSAPPPAPARDPKSIETLLKRFGIK